MLAYKVTWASFDDRVFDVFVEIRIPFRGMWAEHTLIRSVSCITVLVTRPAPIIFFCFVEMYGYRLSAILKHMLHFLSHDNSFQSTIQYLWPKAHLHLRNAGGTIVGGAI